MELYKNIILKVLSEGVYTSKINGVDSINYFAFNYKVNVTETIPILTTRKIYTKTIIAELLWMISGEKRITELKKHTSIWNNWADENDYLETSYGRFWRFYPTQNIENAKEKWIKSNNNFLSVKDGVLCFDQLLYILNQIKSKPNSRKHIISFWHPGNANFSNSAPCPIVLIFNVKGNLLNLHLTQRSCDLAIGFAYDLTLYSLLLKIVAKEVGLTPNDFSHSIVDAHLYVGENNFRGSFYKDNIKTLQKMIVDSYGDFNPISSWIEKTSKHSDDKGLDHIPNILRQISRKPYTLPKVLLPDKPILDIKLKDIEFLSYQSHDKINFGLVL